MNVLGVELANVNELFYLDHGNLSCHSDVWIKVTGSFAEYQVAAFVGDISLDQRNIRYQSAFHDIGAAVKFALFLALGHHRTCTCCCIKGRNTSATCTQALCECPLWGKFDVDLASKVLACKFFIFPHIGRYHFTDLAGFQQAPHPTAVSAASVHTPANRLFHVC